MYQITSRNFDENYKNISEEIKNCTFLSFDCEFSGLNGSFKESLFDSPTERYTKIKNNLNDYLILQFGLGIFKFDRSKNQFSNSSYSFYLFPNSTPVSKNVFKGQPSAFRFLCKTDFDWRKVFEEGLGSLPKDEEKKLLQMIQDESLSCAIYDQLWFDEKDSIRSLCSEVASWAAQEASPELKLKIPFIDSSFLFYLSETIRSRFPDLWTFYTDSSHLTVKKVSQSQKHLLKLQETPVKVIDDYFRGFSKVFSDIITSKKPFVGHNCLKDLAIMYQQFVGPLPKTYHQFKKEINSLFPIIFDTKHLTYNLRNWMPREADFEVNSLEDLYRYLRYGKGSSMIMFTPSMEFHPDGKFHDAGFDAFCTGFCFMKLAYFFSVMDDKGVVHCPKSPISWSRIVSSLEDMKNNINIIRAQTDYINLGGPDPISCRPHFLHVESKKKLDLDILQESIARFGCYDIRSLSQNRALLAASNRGAAKNIQQTLKQLNLQVTTYIPLRHRVKGPTVLMVGVMVALLFTTARFLSFPG